jgi:hypothetical protein
MNDVDAVLARLERIQTLTAQLAKAKDDAVAAQALAEKIRCEIEFAKAAVRPFRTYDPT